MALTISDEAFNLIVTEEASDEAYYMRHYRNFDWPQGASGPTIGIGYDCGYVTTGEARVDWDGIIGDSFIEVITTACGLRGEDAAQFVNEHRDAVTVTWNEALAEFRNREVPKWIARVQAALPNIDNLTPTCLGVLVSLSYNRGTGGYADPHPRDAEMRAIKAHMAALQFDRIPADILSMQRLWPKAGDLWNRRADEAALFQKGLAP